MDQIKDQRLNKATILILLIAISAVFIVMIFGFLKPIFLAAVFAGMLTPLYKKISVRIGNKTSLASVIVLLLLVFIILIPIFGIFLIIFKQAVNVADTALPMLKGVMKDPDEFLESLEHIPIVHEIFPNTEKLLVAINNVVEKLTAFIIAELSVITTGAASFTFAFFIFLYTLYFFLIRGHEYLEKILYYLPLKNNEEDLLISKFVKVTKATLKGSLLIGLVQGTVGAIVLYILGIPNVVFWGLIMTICSIIPALGSGIVWLPAALFLIVTGSVVKGIILIAVGIVIIGNIDNILRPKLVGKDAGMSDLMILFSTLGGIALFGISGIVVGPIIAALFLTIWEIYGESFKNSLFRREVMVEPEVVTPKPVENVDKNV